MHGEIDGAHDAITKLLVNDLLDRVAIDICDLVEAVDQRILGHCLGFLGLLGNWQALGHAFQITSDEVLTWNQIYGTIAAALGVTANIVHIPSEFIHRYDEEWGDGLLGDKAHCMIFDNSKIHEYCPDFIVKIPFKKGVEEQLEEEDFETHYNLGVAYHEMGLYEDAIEELQIACMDPELQADAYFLMGNCARDLERPDVALSCYEKVLEIEGLDHERRRGIRYEQALTLRTAGQDEEALQIFREIHQEASDYRDTERQIQEIMQASNS